MIEDLVSEEQIDIIDAIYNGVLIIDSDGIIVKCNKTACELIGKSEEELLKQHITSINKDATLYQVALDGVPLLNVQHLINGKHIVSNETPIYSNEKLVGAIAVFQEVTELNQTLNLLDEKEKEVKYLKNILELLYDGVIVVDKKGHVTMINQNYCDFLGVQMDDVIGKHVTEVIKNTRMHIVVKTGQAEIGSFMKVRDENIVVMRTPIWRDGEVVGAVGKVLYSDVNELKTLVQRLNVAESNLDYYKQELKKVRGAKYSFNQIIGEHERMKEAKELAMKVAPSRSTVLIRGESGTGKELFAHAIHEASKRSEGPFISLNCAALPPDLLEAELFGYEEGAFTGAKKGGKPGKIELAHGGTLFLDEVGDMPLNMQVKLLRVLQEREFERVGGNHTYKVDIRLISATNRPLEEMVKKSEFREDLYYRLNVFQIVIPPLRERGQDIITTAHLILGQLNSEFGKNISRFDSEVEEFFLNYHWPGNVRELQNVIERALHVAEGGPAIRLEHFPPYLLNHLERHSHHANYTLTEQLEKAEKIALVRALEASNGNRSLAAKLLGIHRASLYRKLEKHGLLTDS